MTRATYPGALTTEEREQLLSLAGDLARRSGEKAARQAAAALAVLRAEGVQGLRRVLATARVELGASRPHWERFREVCGQAVVEAASRGPAHAGFLLVWIRRLSLVVSEDSPGDGPVAVPRRPPESRQ
jgi:predicted component of type VI protein secretion system